ncbi:MAG: NADH-quinone oxidoreductase subunit NuoG [Alphaproteobacteria bacterium]|nr:NADH-quinone oxidoreductase subunit NuoG [Alphaproteobacteria bacterium]
MVKLTIDGRLIEVEPGTTILQACEQLEIEVPVFCYHSKLSIAGNCRMCLVEVAGSAKPVASCAMPAVENMIVNTQSQMVEKARKGSLEFLLINHPLDCPICDQGGECDLQDITVAYGRGESRFDLNKRAVTDKYMGPLVKTTMTRCIHCTRCVRFADEIAGVSEIGTLGRGENMEITTYLEGAIRSELSGNLIDICPVGALTSKPYAFHGRSWELTKTESVDVLDAVGSNIRIDTRGREVMRILPRLNEEINEEWISDRTRFAYDGLKYQRLDTPYVRIKGKLKPARWEEAFEAIQEKLKTLKGAEIAAIAGDLADVESMKTLKDLMIKLESPHLDCRQDGSLIPYDSRSHYIMNTSISELENADCILLIGTNPRHEAPLVNARIRKTYLKGGTSIGVIGPKTDLTYKYEWIGESSSNLKGLVDGAHPFSENLKKAKRPVLILGQAVFKHADMLAILYSVQALLKNYKFIQKDWNGYNVLHNAASRVGGLDVGFVPQKGGFHTSQILAACQKGKIKLLYLLGADEIPMDQLGETFVIYQGHHGDKGAHRADVILPGCAYTEKMATYVNTEGRVQLALQAVPPPGEAKEDWMIIHALAASLGLYLPYNNWDEIQISLKKMQSAFDKKGEIVKTPWQDFELSTRPSSSNEPFILPIHNFYMNDPITRHSTNMASCVREIAEGKQTDG